MKQWTPIGTGKYHAVKMGQKVYQAHRLIVESVLGHELPIGSIVHHIDGNRNNNENSNLVVCPDEIYHQLLHIRQDALQACGNANNKRCRYCNKWDTPSNLRTVSRGKHEPRWHHRECKNENTNKYREKCRENYGK